MRDRTSAFVAVLAVGVVTVLTLSPGTAGAHSVRYASRVTIGTNPVFHGSVISRSAGCERSRAVRIYRVDPGTDGLLTTTRAGSDGRWRFLSPSLNGDFYATIGARVFRSAGHRHVCNRARSTSVRAQP